jgi:hypothetical protein
VAGVSDKLSLYTACTWRHGRQTNTPQSRWERVAEGQRQVARRGRGHWVAYGHLPMLSGRGVGRPVAASEASFTQ